MSETVFEFPVRVYYEDTDAGGVVYHSNYINFMERARTEWLRNLGFEQDDLIERMQVLFAVRKLTIDYRKPALFNQALVVKTSVTDVRKASLTFEQDIYLQTDDVILTTGEVKIACLDSQSLRPAPIPREIQEKLQHG